MRFKLSFIFCIGCPVGSVLFAREISFFPIHLFCIYRQENQEKKDGREKETEKEGRRRKGGGEVTFVKYGFTCALNITYLPVLKLT